MDGDTEKCTTHDICNKNNGVYILLYHGRKTPEEAMETWGYDGPLLGPFDAVTCTYQSTIMVYKDHEDICKILTEFLTIVKGLIYYDGVFYGDMQVCSDPPEGTVPEEYDPDKSILLEKG